jgi:hypothetical protein
MAIYTPSEYSKKFPFGNKFVSAMTIKRRCAKGMLHCGHKARQLPGKSWVIEVPDTIVATLNGFDLVKTLFHHKTQT